MGLRTAAKNFLKKVFGDALYREFRDAYRNVRYGDDKREGRVTGDLNDSKWQSVGASTYKWVSPSKALGVAPELEEAKVAPKEPEIDVVEEEQRPLLCEKFLVKDHLLIDHVDKSGNATRRRVRVEEV